ncbi:MAG: hypothetical protein GVY27_07585, partial [Deinococcus-Thermus bacterium]|nr:hypothetical protein [Deinococcota bacterium]
PRDADHVHALLDADPAAPPKAIRQWLKRWLGESLTQTFGPPPRRWWAEGGSTKPVTTQPYLERATPYINNQRTTPLDP